MNTPTKPTTNLMSPSKTDIQTTARIVAAVSDQWNVTARQLEGHSRKQPLALARQVAMALIYQETSYTLATVASLFDKMDHTTVKHAVTRVTGIEDAARKIEAIKNQLEL